MPPAVFFVHRQNRCFMTKRSPIDKKRLRRIPGEHLQKEIKEKVLDAIVLNIIFPFSVAFGMLTAILISSFSYYCIAWIAFVFFALWALHGYFRFKKVNMEISCYRLGRDGELLVGQVLENGVKYGWNVFHDFQMKSVGNIDHIVIAPQGIFAIETKTVSKFDNEEKIVYDGKSVRTDSGRTLDSPLSQAERQARELKEFLRIRTGKLFSVQSIVTYPGWGLILKEVNCAKCSVWVMLTNAILTKIPEMGIQLSEKDRLKIIETKSD